MHGHPIVSRRILTGWLTALCGVIAATACAKPPPPTIEELRARTPVESLRFDRDLGRGDGYSAYLVRYESAGHTVGAMVAVPDGERPESGYPVIVAAHGFHPDPPKYGFTAAGVDSRPGDYYRFVPASYTAHGFMVVVPDYRGHNDSEGLEFTDGFLATSYYTEDVVNLVDNLPLIDGADIHRVFLWGHSLGGEVALRALLATDSVRGASLWSSVGGELWDQAYYYDRYEKPLEPDASDIEKERVLKLRRDIAALAGSYDWRESEPLKYLNYLTAPVIIHHGIGDTGAAYKWSERLAKSLYLGGQTYRFFSYDTSDHLLTARHRATAIDRDIGFFNRVLQTAGRSPRVEN